MLIELLVATALTATQPALPPLPPVSPADATRARKLLRPQLPDLEQRLPNGGRACLIISRCDPRPCVRLAQRGAPLPPRPRCGPRERAPRPRVIPAGG